MLVGKIHTTNINFGNRIIKKPKFVHHIPLNIKLSDTIFVYNDGKRWKLVPLSILTRYPIIFDKHYDQIKTKRGKFIISDITVTYCPYTGSSIIYYGKYTTTGEVYNNNIILADNNNIMPQLTGILYDRKTKKQIHDIVRREEVKIMTLRNAISKYPDYVFLKQEKDIDPLVSETYYHNNTILYPITHSSSRFHPKTLVYGIEYKSNDIEYKNKYSVIVSDDASKNKYNSRDLKINKYTQYFDKMMEEIRLRGGIIIPALWFAWYGMFPKSRVVKL